MRRKNNLPLIYQPRVRNDPNPKGNTMNTFQVVLMLLLVAHATFRVITAYFQRREPGETGLHLFGIGIYRAPMGLGTCATAHVIYATQDHIENMGVLHHEVSHVLNKDVRVNILLSVMCSLAFYGPMITGDYDLVLIGLALTMLGAPALSRHHERKADKFAATSGYGEDLIEALKKAPDNQSSTSEYAGLTKLVYGLFVDTHPSNESRIENIRRHMV